MSLSDKKRDTLADRAHDGVVNTEPVRGRRAGAARAGADPDKRDERGQTPLAGAAFKGLVEVAEAPVEGASSVNDAGVDGRTPLMMAAALGATEAAATLANL